MKKQMLPLLAGAMLMIATSAMAVQVAVPTLSLYDGTTTIVVTDGGAGDLNPISGAVTYLGPIGNWNLNVSTGLSDPLLGPLGFPHMELNSVNASTAPGTLQIMWTDTGFTAVVPGFSTLVGGTLANGATANFQTWLDSGNAAFGLTTQLANMNFGPGGAFSGTTDTAAATGSLFSMTEVATLTHTSAGGSSFDLEVTPVPEPGTMVLLGVGMAGLVIFGKRRMNKEA
jgi:hypothetical protein